MKPLSKFLKLDFFPFSSDLGLLALRVWLGLSMFLIHGLGKLKDFQGTVTKFQEGMGIPKILGSAAVLSESLCALLLVIGLATRWAALFLAITMAVAFYKVHGMVLTQGDPKSGEMAFLYLAGFVALFLAGPGKWSLDAKVLR